MEQIKKFLSAKGFSPSQINKIINSYAFKTYSYTDTLLEQIENSIKWLEDNKYDEKAIIHMATDIPSILCLDPKSFQDRVDFLANQGFSNNDIKRITKLCPHVFSYSIEEKLKPSIDNLKTKKLTDNEIIKIFVKSPKLFSASTVTINDIFKKLQELGFNKTQSKNILKKAPSSFNSLNTIPVRFENLRNTIIKGANDTQITLRFDKRQVVKMISDCPTILTYNTDSVRNKITNLFDLGFTTNNIKQMLLKSSPLLCLSPNTVKKKLDIFHKIGYTKKETIKVLQNMPTLFNLTKKRINSSFENMEKYGFSKSTFKDMTLSHASLLNLTNKLMNSKLEALEKLGFSKEEIINITSTAPTLITSSIEMTRDKIEYLRSIGLGSIITKTPANLITSTATIFARYEFFKNRQPPVKIDDEHYANLFISWRNFEKKYDIKKDDLLKKYNYSEFCNKQKTERSNDGR